MIDFLVMGSSYHQIDDKNRLRIPSKFRKMLLGENGDRSYYFLRGKDDCVCVMDEDTLKEKLQYIASSPVYKATPESREFYRNIFLAEEDAQGRVVLPPALKEIAGIEKDILTIAQGAYLEIWAAEKYTAHTVDVDYNKIFESMRF